MADIIGIDTSIGVNWQVGGFEAKTLQVLAGVQNGVMFYWRSDDMVALFLRSKGDAFDGQVIAFGATAQEGDFGRAASKDIGYLFASAVDGLHSMAPQSVDTAGIAIFCCKVRKHDVQHAW